MAGRQKHDSGRGSFPVKMVMSDGKTLTGPELRTQRAKDYACRRKREEAIYVAHLEGQSPEFIAERFNCTVSYVNRVVTYVGGAIGLRNQAQLQVMALKQVGNLMVDLDAEWDFHQSELHRIQNSEDDMVIVEVSDTPKGEMTKKVPKSEAISRLHDKISKTHAKFFDALASVAPKHMILQTDDPIADRQTPDLENELEILKKRKRKLIEAAPGGVEEVN